MSDDARFLLLSNPVSSSQRREQSSNGARLVFAGERVLPDPQHAPAGFPQQPVHDPIAFPIGRIFVRQNAAFCFGHVACVGQPCQKQPSTKMTSRRWGKTKSGLPKTGQPRRHPVIPLVRNSAISFNSVSLLPEPRMSAITVERFRFEKTSDTSGTSRPGGQSRYIPATRISCTAWSIQ